MNEEQARALNAVTLSNIGTIVQAVMGEITGNDIAPSFSDGELNSQVVQTMIQQEITADLKVL
jgi:hypothetical protein